MEMKYVHTCIVARDWRRLVDFYVTVFGCTVKPPERDMEGRWLSRGTGVENAAIRGVHLILPGWGENGPTLEIFQYRESLPKPDRPAANRRGYSHIAFQTDDVNTVLDNLVAQGGSEVGQPVSRDFPGGSITFVYAADPEGNIVEIQSRD